MNNWAGNAMHVAAVGSVLLWVAVFGQDVQQSPAGAVGMATSFSDAEVDTAMNTQAKGFVVSSVFCALTGVLLARLLGDVA